MNLQSAVRKLSATSLWWALVLVVAGLAAYRNSFSGPFIYDDLPSIRDNPTIRHLWPIWPVLSPPHGITTDGRPLLNFSFAVNYALGGDNPWGYHALNLAIHMLAGLALFGLVRRTLEKLDVRDQGSDVRKLKLEAENNLASAFCIALLWTLHPLQTEAVTYVVQRAESLMGLFYLLTLYCFARYASEAEGQRREARGQKKFRFTLPDIRHPTSDIRHVSSCLWPIASCLACLLGMASKEVMVSAPLMVLLYDRTFVAGTFRDAWNRRRRFYIALASTWLLLGYLVIRAGADRGGTAGFDVGVAWWAYWLTQFKAIAHYLWLTAWPHPLVFEYGTYWVKHAAEILPYAPVVVLLVIGTVIALWRRPVLGFLGVWFFAILAPTSLVPGPTQMIVEHRMYLPLAAVIALAVGGIHALGRLRSIVVFAAIAVVIGLLTERRNRDYRSDLAIWSDTVAKRPNNAIAHYNLGTALFDAGRFAEAISHFQEAMRLKADYLLVRNNIGNALFRLGRAKEAIDQYQELLRLKPDDAAAHENLGNTFLQMGRMDEAVGQYEEVLKLKPGSAEAHDSLGNALLLSGRMEEAMNRYQEALRLEPDSAKIHYDFGTALARTGRQAEAVGQYQEALRLKPTLVAAHNNLGAILVQMGRMDEAVEQYQEALRLKPDYIGAHFNLGNVLLRMGRNLDAMDQYREVLRLDPDNAAARRILAQMQALH
ncbi:MAG: tetratricopeptide repeat protein [Verrucomicrobiota bacterium]|nr:tetratricopeptide repeat protein [Verrucomicrobiota bacterium]